MTYKELRNSIKRIERATMLLILLVACKMAKRFLGVK